MRIINTEDMQETCISVVIPIYNVEDYLKRCIDSVLRQTHRNLEIILVDDGSPDHSPEICDQYALEDKRVVVIHKENGGLASARNAGMRIMTGQFLFFLDSDDWLEPDGLELLLKKALEYNVDFVRYRAIRTGWPGLPYDAPCVVESVRELSEGLYDRNRIIREIYPRLLATPQLTMGAVVGAWGSLYNVNFIEGNHLRFYEDVRFSEDLIFSANAVKAANSFYFIEKAGVYHYFYNPKSISKSFRKGRWEACKKLISHSEEDFGVNADYDFKEELVFLRWFCILTAFNERKHLKTYTAKRDYCRSLLEDDVPKKTKLRLGLFDVPYKQKLVMILIKLRIAALLAMI